MADEQSVTLVIKGRNLSGPEFAAARQQISGFKSDVDDTSKHMGGFGGVVKTAVGTMAGFISAQAILGGVSGAFSFAKDAAIGMNASLEKSTLQFTTLMGDSQRAEKHVRDLFQFAKTTPFETGPIIEASRLMQTFGGDSLNTMDNLTLLGDAAAATGAPIEALGMWSGRLYAALQGGQPIGEATMRLMELGVITPQVRTQLETLAEKAGGGQEAFKLFQNSLGGFSGAMVAQANTWDGLMSSISDAINITLADALLPFFDAAKAGAQIVLAALGSEGVGRAFTGLKDTLSGVFGGDGRALIVGFIDALLGMASSAMTALDVLHRGLSGFDAGLRVALGAVIGVAEGVVASLAIVARGAAALDPSGLLDAASAKIDQAQTSLRGLRESQEAQAKASLEAARGQSGFSQTLAAGQTVIQSMRVALTEAAAAGNTQAEASRRGGAATTALGDAAGHTKKEIAALRAEQDVAAKVQEQALKWYEESKKAVKEVEEAAAKVSRELSEMNVALESNAIAWSRNASSAALAIKRISDGVIANAVATVAAQRGADEEGRRLSMSSMVFELDQIQRAGQAKKAGIDTTLSGWREAYAAIDAETAARMANVVRTHKESADGIKGAGQGALSAWERELDGLVDSMVRLAQVSGSTFGGIVQQIATVITAMKAGQQAGEAMHAGIGQMRTGNASAGLTSVATGAFGAAAALGQATSQGSTLNRTLGGMATGAKIGMAFGPWGAAIGAAAGAVVGLVRGLTQIPAEVKKAREEVDKFQGALSETLTKTQLQEAGGERWKMTVIAVRDAYIAAGKSAGEAEAVVRQLWDTDHPDRARAAMQQIAAVMGNVQAEQEILNRAVQEYGFTIEELGPKFRAQRLSEQAQRLVEDYAVLIESGIEQGTVTQRMADKTNEYLAAALRTGAEVPESMRPMLEKMIEMGLLTDENGEKLGSLERLTWAQSMTQGFDRVVGAVERLISAIGRSGDAAGDAADAINHTMRNTAIPALEDTAAAIEDVIQMHSPTGLEGIAHYAGIAGEKLKLMAVGGVSYIGGLRDSINGATGSLASLLSGMASVGAERFTGDKTKTEAALASGDWLSTEQAIARAQAAAGRHGSVLSDADLAAMGDTYGQRDGLFQASAVDAFLAKLEARILNYDTGTGGTFPDFGAGRLARLHAREAVTPFEQRVPTAQRWLAESGMSSTVNVYLAVDGKSTRSLTESEYLAMVQRGLDEVRLRVPARAIAGRAA